MRIPGRITKELRSGSPACALNPFGSTCKSGVTTLMDIAETSINHFSEGATIIPSTFINRQTITSTTIPTFSLQNKNSGICQSSVIVRTTTVIAAPITGILVVKIAPPTVVPAKSTTFDTRTRIPR